MMAQHPGVRINIPPLSVQKDELSIAGEKEGVLAVKATIDQIWKDMEKKWDESMVRPHETTLKTFLRRVESLLDWLTIPRRREGWMFLKLLQCRGFLYRSYQQGRC